jgi:hypothetical protein
VTAAGRLALAGPDPASLSRLLLRSARVVPQVVEPQQGARRPQRSRRGGRRCLAGVEVGGRGGHSWGQEEGRGCRRGAARCAGGAEEVGGGAAPHGCAGGGPGGLGFSLVFRRFGATWRLLPLDPQSEAALVR